MVAKIIVVNYSSPGSVRATGNIWCEGDNIWCEGVNIIESVDSICRDGADTPISLNKSNGSELPNADVLSLFRQTTCSVSASIHYNTLKVRKIYSYSDSQKFVKTRIVHHLLLFFFFFFFFFLIQFKRPTAKLGLVIALILSRKSFILERT